MSVRTGDVMAEPSPRWTRLVIVGIVLIIAALVWITWQALRLEDRERAARQEAAFQESLRLALWRMDSALTPIIAREAARPYFEYQSFYPADRAMRSLDEPATLDDVLVPSPLLTANDPSIRVYFQVGPDGSLTSPQAPEGWTQRVAEGVYVTPYVTRNARDNIASLRDMLTQQRARLAKARQSSDPKEIQVAEELAKPASPAAGRSSTFSDADTSGKLSDYMQRRSVASQAANVVNAPAAQQVKEAPKREESRDAADMESNYGAADRQPDSPRTGFPAFADRTKVAAPAPDIEVGAPAPDDESLALPTPIVQTDPAVQPGEFIAKWLPSSSGEPELVFTREIRVGSQRIEQGFWVNWPLLREQVMASARELVPAASLKPVLESPIALPPETLGRMLASVPAELVVSRDEPSPGPLWSPLRSALLATWLVVLAAMVGLVFVARAATQLAERRGRFVSAVTHELRTPLTTFRMYSQMLADGMVSSQDAQREYAKTLYDESGRLARIVESVLDYARLGRGKSQQPVDETSVGDLLDGMLPGLVAHAASSGMTLAVEGLTDDVRARRIRTDGNRVQRVLLNLVENACKYAKDAADRRVLCIIEVEHRDLRVCIRDFGPGVPARERAAIFKPFTRGAAHAHGSVPGLGLGLALCRALAEQLGGSLALTGHAGGAEFTLTLPLSA